MVLPSSGYTRLRVLWFWGLGFRFYGVGFDYTGGLGFRVLTSVGFVSGTLVGGVWASGALLLSPRQKQKQPQALWGLGLGSFKPRPFFRVLCVSWKGFRASKG